VRRTRSEDDQKAIYNAEIERANLEHLLVHPDSLPIFRDILAEHDFHLLFHKDVWRAAIAAQDAGAPLDTTFVCAVRATLQRQYPDLPHEVIGTALGNLIRP
jgi:replicative DNA helicase